jgi:hypothetical protein
VELAIIGQIDMLLEMLAILAELVILEELAKIEELAILVELSGQWSGNLLRLQS